MYFFKGSLLVPSSYLNTDEVSEQHEEGGVEYLVHFRNDSSGDTGENAIIIYKVRFEKSATRSHFGASCKTEKDLMCFRVLEPLQV